MILRALFCRHLFKFQFQYGAIRCILIDKITVTVKTWLPKILLELKGIELIANIEGENEQLKAVLAEFKLSSDETKNIFYHGFCSLILEKLADGEVSWSDSIVISEYYFQNVAKK